MVFLIQIGIEIEWSISDPRKVLYFQEEDLLGEGLMKVLKDWYQEKYDSNQTIHDFISFQFYESRSASYILKMVREACPDIEIPELNDEEIKSLVENNYYQR